jgi:hypothetical protein
LSVKTISNEVYQKLTYSDIPHLIDTLSFFNLSPTITQLSFNYTFIGLVGPVFFFSVYHFMAIDNASFLVIKDCLYSLQLDYDLQQAKKFVRNTGVPIVGLIVLSFFIKPDPNYLQMGHSLLEAASTHIPTAESHPILFILRNGMADLTYAMSDILFSAGRGVSKAYALNLAESFNTLKDALANLKK